MSCIWIRTPQPTGVLERLKFSLPPRTASKVRRLSLMAVDWNPKIRAAAAGNRMLSAADMDWLSFDSDELVRAWVLRNPKVTLGVVKRMAETDASPSIRQYAKFLLTHRFNVE